MDDGALPTSFMRLTTELKQRFKVKTFNTRIFIYAEAGLAHWTCFLLKCDWFADVKNVYASYLRTPASDARLMTHLSLYQITIRFSDNAT